MALTHEDSKVFAPDRARIAYQWSASIQAACDTLSRMPRDLMDSITVTGRLGGRREESRLLCELSYELARKSGLRACVETEPAGFTVRFTRVTDG